MPGRIRELQTLSLRRNRVKASWENSCLPFRIREKRRKRRVAGASLSKNFIFQQGGGGTLSFDQQERGL